MGRERSRGPIYDLHVPVAVPIVVGPQGGTRVVPPSSWSEELELLMRRTKQILANLDTWAAG